MLADSASRLFADLGTSEHLTRVKEGSWIADEWRAIEQAGLSAAAISEVRGGVGAELQAQATIVRLAAYYNVSAPLAETFLAETMLDRAALPARHRALTVAPVVSQGSASLTRSGEQYLVSGELHRVPWARHVPIVVAADFEGRVATVIVDAPVDIRRQHNVADEPRDTVHLNSFPVSSGDVGIGQECLSRDDVFVHGALLRSAAMLGALERVLDITVRYAADRVQFGRPIGKFQAVQQMVSVLASQVAACGIAVESAVKALDRSGADLQIAAAKTRVSEAAGSVAALAHQVHGAIGISREYALNLSTRRLWSWRDEFGSETEWSERIGSMLGGIGAAGMWLEVTR